MCVWHEFNARVRGLQMPTTSIKAKTATATEIPVDQRLLFLCFVTSAGGSFHLIDASWAAPNSTFGFINASGAVPNSTFVLRLCRAS